ncbi:MGMT family protein [Ornithinimicrobium pratense]|uniref:Cysteine methyltransferase n=1 Tax=Ornithinimicrobium pratense TaxID=2593973 RepID=A0A5J6V4D9_9MICO|nr:MGMT family protein [Ornithinimicrobium pratense]QFG68830.1 cysteine methyltransferase [Ornithinimicrobium pratense]
MDEVLVERVLRAVEQVPPGRVVSYGDLGALVGTGPRHVGRILREWGSGVPWWRVTRRDGTVYALLLARAKERWQQEGIEVAASGAGCRFQVHRADLERLARDYGRAAADLPHAAG